MQHCLLCVLPGSWYVVPTHTHTNTHTPFTLGEVEGMLDVLRCAYEDRVHGLEREHSQYRTDAEQREQSTARLLQDCERENETLAERNQTLSRELKELQTRHRVAELSLKVFYFMCIVTEARYVCSPLYTSLLSGSPY